MVDTEEGDNTFVGLREAEFTQRALEERVITAGEEMVYEAARRIDNVFKDTVNGELATLMRDSGFTAGAFNTKDVAYLLGGYELVYKAAESTGHKGVVDYAAELLSGNLGEQLKSLSELKGKYEISLMENMRRTDVHGGSALDPSTRSSRRALSFGLEQTQTYMDAVNDFLRRINNKQTPPAAPSASGSQTSNPNDDDQGLAAADGADEPDFKFCPPEEKKPEYILNPPCFEDRFVNAHFGTVEYVAVQVGDRTVVYLTTSAIETILNGRDVKGRKYNVGSANVYLKQKKERGLFCEGGLLEFIALTTNSSRIRYFIRSDKINLIIPDFIRKSCINPDDAFAELSKKFRYQPMDEDRIDIEGLEAELKKYKLMPEDAHLRLHGDQVYSFEELADKGIFKNYNVADISTRADALAQSGNLFLRAVDADLGDASPKGIMRSDVLTLYWSLRDQQQK